MYVCSFYIQNHYISWPLEAKKRKQNSWKHLDIYQKCFFLKHQHKFQAKILCKKKKIKNLANWHIFQTPIQKHVQYHFHPKKEITPIKRIPNYKVKSCTRWRKSFNHTGFAEAELFMPRNLSKSSVFTGSIHKNKLQVQTLARPQKRGNLTARNYSRKNAQKEIIKTLLLSHRQKFQIQTIARF